MEINKEELEKDLTEQYAILVEEEQEEKKKKRYLILFIVFLFMFLMIFGTTFSYMKIYNNNEQQIEGILIKDLYIEGYEDSFEFDNSIHNYVIYVPAGTKILNVKYILWCQKCSVDIKGNDDLNTGSNEIEIVVKDKDGNEEKYIIYVIVEENSSDDNNNSNNDNNSNNSNNSDNGNTNNGDDNNIISNNVETNNNDDSNISTDNDKIANLNIKSLSVTNHTLNEPFDSNKTSYIVKGIKNNEQSVEMIYELVEQSNIVVIKLNGEIVTRIPTKEGNINKLPFDVASELLMGANKVEITIKDNKGNEKTYYIYLVVEKFDENDQIVKEITVEYGNNNGIYRIDNIVPGWESTERQYIRITNKSNYDVKVDIDWVQVENTFVNREDLKYTLFVENSKIKTNTLPYSDENIIKELEIKANSSIYCYISYKYIYRDIDQNIDQGKSFSGMLKVSLSQ